MVAVHSVTFSNDGTALKPSIQFDEQRNINVGLEKNEVSLQYCRDNPFLDAKDLKEQIITEAIVSSLTSIDNKLSLPVAVDYSAKSGKSGTNMNNLFTSQILLLQMCDACQKMSPSKDLILTEKSYEKCSSYCDICYKEKKVCASCTAKGQTDYVPSMRACDYCLRNNLKCYRRVILVLSADCETGNKECMKQLQKSIMNGTIDPKLSLLTPLPDVPHILKTCRGSFSNWWLQIGDERGNLALFYTLRNRAETSICSRERKFLPKNDYVINRDWQNTNGVLKIGDDEFVKYISKIGKISNYCH